jgi:hypothetical protein
VIDEGLRPPGPFMRQQRIRRVVSTAEYLNDPRGRISELTQARPTPSVSLSRSLWAPSSLTRQPTGGPPPPDRRQVDQSMTAAQVPPRARRKCRLVAAGPLGLQSPGGTAAATSRWSRRTRIARRTRPRRRFRYCRWNSFEVNGPLRLLQGRGRGVHSESPKPTEPNVLRRASFPRQDTL